MKKIIAAFVGVSMLVPVIAFARTTDFNGGSLDCDTGIFTDAAGGTSTMSTSRCNGGGNPAIITEAWGLTAQATPVVSSGATIKDEGGVSYTCPFWFTISGCYDLTHTDYYRTQMTTLGSQLKAMGYSGGTFAYWIK